MDRGFFQSTNNVKVSRQPTSGVLDVMATARPFLMFTGNAQTAMDPYVATLPNSRIMHVERYPQGEPGPVDTVKIAVFTLCGREFMCSDSPIKHDFTFTPSSSIFVEFSTEEELDRAFGILSDEGRIFMPLGNYGFSQRFGWLSDRFGVSWQLNRDVQ
jgi:predicted 3-demethylubiquinone-9 3-methyltransferase (glyoxalase superfamily)